MIPRPPKSTRTYTLLPSTALSRSHHQQREHGQRLGTAERRDGLRERRDHDGEDRGLRHAPRAETLDDPRVREIGDGDADRDAREYQREQRARVEHLGDDMLAAIEIAEQRPLHPAGREDRMSTRLNSSH